MSTLLGHAVLCGGRDYRWFAISVMRMTLTGKLLDPSLSPSTVYSGGASGGGRRASRDPRKIAGCFVPAALVSSRRPLGSVMFCNALSESPGQAPAEPLRGARGAGGAGLSGAPHSAHKPSKSTNSGRCLECWSFVAGTAIKPGSKSISNSGPPNFYQ